MLSESYLLSLWTGTPWTNNWFLLLYSCVNTDNCSSDCCFITHERRSNLHEKLNQCHREKTPQDWRKQGSRVSIDAFLQILWDKVALCGWISCFSACGARDTRGPRPGECTALCMLCQHSGFSLASVKPGESQMLKPSTFLLLSNGWSAGKEVRQFQHHFHDSLSNLLGTSAHRCDWQVSPVSVYQLCNQWELLGIWGNNKFFPHVPDPPSSPSLDGCWKQAVAEQAF